MRLKLAACLMMAGGLAACAGTPPPPPPMAAAEPAPARAPMAMAPADGMYSGTVVSTDDSGSRCRKLPATARAQVRSGMFALQGLRGKVGPDGSVTAAGHRGMTMSGMFANGTLDVTTTGHGCGYHYSLTHA